MLIQVCIMFLLCLFAYLLVGCNAFIFDILCTLMTSRGDTKWPLSGPVTYDNKLKEDVKRKKTHDRANLAPYVGSHGA